VSCHQNFFFKAKCVAQANPVVLRVNRLIDSQLPLHYRIKHSVFDNDTVLNSNKLAALAA